MYYLTYVSLEIKKALKTIGHILLGVVTLVLLIGVIVLAATKLLYQDVVVERMTVAVVQTENNTLSNMAMDIIGSMDSVESFCDFVYLDEEEALVGMKANEIFATMVIPNQLVEDIMNGTNTPVIIILPEDPGIEASLFKELTDAGAVILGSSQAGIYAVTDYCIEHGLTSQIQEAQDILNGVYLNRAMSRESYFKYSPVSGTGDMTTIQYYIAYGIILFLFLCGIPFAIILKEDSKTLKDKLTFSGIGSMKRAISKVIAIGTLLFCIALLFGMVGIGAYYGITGELFLLSFWDFIGLAITILAVSAIIVFIYRAAGNPVGGVMLLFLSTIVMIFCSGGFIPSAFLPNAIRNISPWLPTTILAKQIGSILTEVYSFANFMKTILIIFIFVPLTSVVRN